MSTHRGAITYAAVQGAFGEWRFCADNGAGVHPIGYCAGTWMAKTKHRVDASKFHDHGHASKEEAEACALAWAAARLEKGHL